jgi:hypothetical protein
VPYAFVPFLLRITRPEPLIPNPDKPEPTLTVKTKKESKKIEFGTQELTKVKTNIS